MRGDLANASREFRALMQSIRAPLEEEMTGSTLPAASRDRMKHVHRNIMQLFRLVNTVFDMAEAEAETETESEVRRITTTAGIDQRARTVVIPALRGDDPAPRCEYCPHCINGSAQAIGAGRDST